MSRDTRAMQDDDTANPGMLGVLDGEALWNARPARPEIVRRLPWRCRDQHERRRCALSGVRCAKGRPVDLEQRINMSRADDQKAAAFAFESKELLEITAYIARQSRGMPIAVKDDAQTKAVHRRRPRIFERAPRPARSVLRAMPRRQMGQELNGNLVPQAHPTGYPIYRLEWQNLGSLQRRLRNCMSGMRMELYVRRAGDGETRIVPDVARPRHGDGDARGAAVTGSLPSPACGERRAKEARGAFRV